MISKQDILSRSAQWQLQPQVVEKDYVLGWLLCSLSKHAEVKQHWVFKGGTCIKKCYQETYRFSEDLDFSLLPETPSYDKDSIQSLLKEIARATQQESGIEIPETEVRVEERTNKQGNLTFEGRVYYRGPLGTPSYARIKFDLTNAEPVIDTPEVRKIFHPYPDTLTTEGITSYSLHELIAEKTRALYERARPRDLYDVVYLLENQALNITSDFLRDLFTKKCAIKVITISSPDDIINIATSSQDMQSEWENMLAHQLPVLPVLTELLARLSPLLGWINTPDFISPVTELASSTTTSDRIPIRSAGLYYSASHPNLEIIRFAGSSRLMLSYEYNGKSRLVEPYSLRQSSTGKILLYAWEISSGQIKAFDVNLMSAVSATNQSFSPRYQVELTDTSDSYIPPISSARRSRISSFSAPRRISSFSTRPTRSVARYTGTRYVIQCLTCQKNFTKTINNTTLNKHKWKGGYGDCPSRRGYLLEIK